MMENDVKQEKKVDDVLRWVTFQLEKEVYGVNVMQVQETTCSASSICAVTW